MIYRFKLRQTMMSRNKEESGFEVKRVFIGAGCNRGDMSDVSRGASDLVSLGARNAVASSLFFVFFNIGRFGTDCSESDSISGSQGLCQLHALDSRHQGLCQVPFFF